VWITLRVAHTAHRPGDGVALFSIVKVQARYPKWPSFR